MFAKVVSLRDHKVGGLCFTPFPLTLDQAQQSETSPFFCLYAEKSGFGHEEGQPEGADHDDCIPRDSFHYSFRFGVFDLRYGCELGLFLYHVEFRMVLDEQNLSHPYNYIYK